MVPPLGMTSRMPGGGNFEGPISASKITQDANHRFVTDAEKSAWNNPTIPMKSVISNNYAMSSTQDFLSITPSLGTKVSLTLPSSAKVGKIYRIFKREYFSLELKAPEFGIHLIDANGLAMSMSVTITKGALITAIFDGTGWYVYPQQ